MGVAVGVVSGKEEEEEEEGSGPVASSVVSTGVAGMVGSDEEGGGVVVGGASVVAMVASVPIRMGVESGPVPALLVAETRTRYLMVSRFSPGTLTVCSVSCCSGESGRLRLNTSVPEGSSRTRRE